MLILTYEVHSDLAEKQLEDRGVVPIKPAQQEAHLKAVVFTGQVIKQSHFIVEEQRYEYKSYDKQGKLRDPCLY